MVGLNVLRRGFGGLVGPLDFYQVAPVPFLWAERLAVEVFGASSWSLRLVPTLCALAAVPLFVLLARRTVGGLAALVAVATFAVSYPPIRHASEIKPYAVDLLTATALLLPAVDWLRRPDRAGPLWLLAALAGPSMALSHPSTFVAGGVGLVLLPIAWRVGRERPELGLRWAGLAFAVVVGLSFVGLLALNAGKLDPEHHALYRAYWSDAFPPLREPVRLLGWLARQHVGAAFGYPIGGERGASAATSILVAVGLVGLWRRGRRDLVALLVAPLGLTLIASAIGQYPYGGSARTMQHVAPMVCLLVGVGVEALIGRIGDPARRARLYRLTLAGLAVIGGLMFVGDLARPYRTAEDQRSRDFARWFWPEMARGAELCCVKASRGTEFDGRYWELGRWELYLIHRALLVPEGVDPARPRLDRVAEDHPLRCVVYNDGPETNPDLRAWLVETRRRFRLRSVREYPVNVGVVDGILRRDEHYRVYEFVPGGPEG